MENLKFALSVIQVILCLVIMVVILCQSSKKPGLSGSIAGGMETFYGKNKSRAKDSVLSKWTVVLFVLLICSTVALNII